MARIWLRRAFAVVVSISLMLVAVAAYADSFNGLNWQASGNGSTSVTPGTGDCVTFNYDASYPNWWGEVRSWNYQTTAAKSGPINFDYGWSGIHAWYMAQGGLTAWADGPNGRTNVALVPWRSVWDFFSFTGTSTLNVTAGYHYGFTMQGKNFDGSWLLRGNLKVCGAAPADTTAPTITPTVSGTQGTNGWYTSPVTVSFACTDPDDKVASCPSPVTFGEGAGQSTTVSAVDSVGNKATLNVGPFNIDLTPPTVSYSGNTGAYTVDQTVSIACAAADNLSGVASTTCADVAGAAYSYPLGNNVFSASATDKAGNTGAGTTSFTVTVTNASLCNLTKQFVANRGEANSLCVKLDNAGKQAAAGNTVASNNTLQAYMNEVAAQSGKALTAAQADVLTRLAKALVK